MLKNPLIVIWVVIFIIGVILARPVTLEFLSGTSDYTLNLPVALLFAWFCSLFIVAGWLSRKQLSSMNTRIRFGNGSPEHKDDDGTASVLFAVFSLSLIGVAPVIMAMAVVWSIFYISGWPLVIFGLSCVAILILRAYIKPIVTVRKV